MALLKNITTNEGFTTQYHKISDVSVRDEHMICILSSYVSQEYRDLERPADTNIFNFSISLEEEESMGIRKLAYTKIKELPEWADAEDC